MRARLDQYTSDWRDSETEELSSIEAVHVVTYPVFLFKHKPGRSWSHCTLTVLRRGLYILREIVGVSLSWHGSVSQVWTMRQSIAGLGTREMTTRR